MGLVKTRNIAIANEKGGVGKSTTVINLGAALSRREKSVLVVDTDPQANATKGLGVDVKDGMITVCDIINDPESNSGHDAIVQTAWKGLDLIPSHVDLAGIEIDLIDEEGRENKLKEGLEEIVGKYDFILIDTPPSLSLLTVNVFTFAKEVLVPCQTHPYAYDALAELFDTVGAVNEEINPDLNVTGIIPTFFDKRTKISNKILNTLKTDERYKELIFNTAIRVNTTIAESTGVGKPVVFYKKSSYGACDYIDLADELLNRK
ncbi:MAG TPA: ParA family protein [Desulfobacteraceae bacterium]|nr:ParA family protein [Desulfobacteraceae bacterium]